MYRDGPYRGRQIPTSVLQTSPVTLYRSQPRELPLDLVQKIISYVSNAVPAKKRGSRQQAAAAAAAAAEKPKGAQK
ncbi:MAG: hypothetical protein INR71_05100 [Terriglobus roseus]|nr:hypothetical protein [Terriglobus roseus]